MSEKTANKNVDAFKNHNCIINIKKQISNNLWLLAISLKTNKDKKYYQLLDYETWESYLATPEISLSRFFVFKLIKNYEIWIEEYNVSQAKLQDIDSEKLYMAGTIATKENYEEMLEKAKQLSRSDLSKEIRTARGESEPEFKSGGYIEEKKIYEVMCPKCGHKFEHVI